MIDIQQKSSLLLLTAVVGDVSVLVGGSSELAENDTPPEVLDGIVNDADTWKK